MGIPCSPPPLDPSRRWPISSHTSVWTPRPRRGVSNCRCSEADKVRGNVTGTMRGGASVNATTTPADDVNALAGRFWDGLLDRSPLLATMLGYEACDDRLDDPGPGGRD